MFRIDPVNYNNVNYRMVRSSKRVAPIDSVKKVSNDGSRNNSNSSNFGQNLEEEIKVKTKKKNK